MTESPTFVLSAAPTVATRFHNFFEDGGARDLLEHPGELRYSGFDLTTGDRARIVRGDSLEVGYSDWKLVQLYEDGTLIAKVPGDEDFLAWASTGNRPFWEHPKLNPLVIVEFVYSFVVLFGRLAPHLNPVPTKVRYRAELRHLIDGTSRVYLTPYALDSVAWLHEQDKYPAQEPSMAREVETDVALSTNQPERMAYLIVERIYTWFGASPDKIPYVLGTGNDRVIDVELVKIGGRKKP